MNTPGTIQPPGIQKKPQAGVNPFARALAETEKGSYNKAPATSNNSLFSEALAKTGGHLPQDFGNTNYNLADYQKHQQDLLAQQEKTRLHKELHDKVNPVDLHDVYKASEKRTQQKLEQIRQELDAYVKEVGKLYQEVSKATFEAVGNQGTEGQGRESYYDKLSAFIRLLTKKVHSARTWLHQQQSKAAKQKNRKVRGGLLMTKGGHQETKGVFDMMHHERSTAYSGG